MENIKNSDESLSEKAKQKYLDELNNYYKLKNEYEEAIYKKKLDIIEKKGIGWKEKKAEFRKYKPKCVKCKRPVGSIFSTNVDKNLNKTLNAVCGDKANPCTLNIHLKIPSAQLIEESLKEDKQDVDTLKNKIIINKNNLLFGYVSPQQSIEEFDTLREDLESLLKLTNSTTEIYYDIIDNPRRKYIYTQKQKKFYEFLDNYKLLISNYDKNREFEFIQEAVEIYVSQLLPLADDIRNIKYAYVNVEKEDNKYFLIEKPIKIENLELGLDFENMYSLENKVSVPSPEFAPYSPAYAPASPASPASSASPASPASNIML